MKRENAILAIGLFSIFASTAQPIELPPIEGLTEEIYYRFSGIWDRVSGDYGNKEEFFSWGKAKYSRDFSLIIDLGAPEAFFSGHGSKFQVISIRKVKEQEYVFNIDIISSPAKSGYFVFHDNGDGTIWFEEHLVSNQSIFGLVAGAKLYRHYGPTCAGTSSRRVLRSGGSSYTSWPHWAYSHLHT